MAYAVISGGLPRPLRSGLMTFSGVASNFAGVPLALAFTFTIGRTGLLTVVLKDGLGFNVYDHGFRSTRSSGSRSSTSTSSCR